jgi:hypothetical protein
MEWLLEFSNRTGINVEDDDKNSCYNAIMRILKDSHIGRVVSVKCPEDPTGSAFCFAVAHNKSFEGLEGVTKENIERLQQAMGGREDPPKWYVLD